MPNSLDALGNILGVCTFTRKQNPTDIDTHRCTILAGHDGPHDLGCYLCGPEVARFVEQEAPDA